MEFKEEIENANLILNHFGYWPSFHDSEIISLKFERNLEEGKPTVEMKVYAFEMTDKVVNRYFKRFKHCIIDFKFVDLQKSEMDGFNHQNAVDGLNFEKDGDNLICEINAAYGVDGLLSAKTIQVVKLEPVEK
ncbi:Imm50 family immunity protein [Pontibacter mangrovi]|uniref:Imm50 family immunity protein n=1 Tax=Pontibacter mangrovi TaxID=2589816 RepID=UPI0015E2AAE9|nr:Imm50 family immunity protein [Pontibacter mangrovi]